MLMRVGSDSGRSSLFSGWQGGWGSMVELSWPEGTSPPQIGDNSVQRTWAFQQSEASPTCDILSDRPVQVSAAAQREGRRDVYSLLGWKSWHFSYSPFSFFLFSSKSESFFMISTFAQGRIFLKNVIGIYLIHIVLVSDVQHSESVVCGWVGGRVSNSLQPHGLQPGRLLWPWNFPSKNTGAGCHFLLLGIFLTQGSNLHILCPLHWQAESVLSVQTSTLFLILFPYRPLQSIEYSSLGFTVDSY